MSGRPPTAIAMEPMAVPLVEAAAVAPRQTQMQMGGVAPRALHDTRLMDAQAQSPAYRALYDNHLICNDYRINGPELLNVIPGEWSISGSLALQLLSCRGCCCCAQFFVVSPGHVRKGTHQNGGYIFFGEGVHVTPGPFISLGQQFPLTDGAIVHGTKAIVTVTQGFVGVAMDRGQPVLLPPGMHQWESQTLQFKELIDLSTSVIRIGPYTLITVDEGYAAVTQDNGEQKILDGGQAYMLTHRNWKFEKFMTRKLQTSDVGPMQVTTGDNVPLQATATANWIIEDPRLAARMAANTMAGPGAGASEFDLSKLRQDVDRQVKASLAAFIGSVSYSTYGHAAMAARVEGDHAHIACQPDLDSNAGGQRALFDRAKLNSSVDHANEISQRYGVKILSINLISAAPSDLGLLEALSKGAVATVAAEQATTAARGAAAALLTQATAEAEAATIKAKGDAAADVIRADGSLTAAQRLEASGVAVDLAKMKAAGLCLKDGNANSFFFGLKSPADMQSGVLGNAVMASAMAGQKS